MARKKGIIHDGEVVDVRRDGVTVKMVCRSACSSCHAKGICSVSDEAVKMIDVPMPPFTLLEPGDKVNVELTTSMGLKAVWISYVIPLAILMILILTLSAFGLKELVTGLSSIAGVAIYYLVIYLIRDRISKEFCFVIKKKDQDKDTVVQ